MTTWLLPVLTALLGYAGHWVQQALVNKHDRRTSDREQMLSLRDRLRVLRSYDDQQYAADGEEALDAVEHDASLLYDAKLRERVRYDCKHAGEWRRLRDSTSREEVWATYLGDAVECLTAVARGDRLPEMDDPTAWLDMQFEYIEAQHPNDLTPEGYVRALEELGTDPDWQEVAYLEWRRYRHKRRGWRRLMPQRSPR